MKSFKVFFVLVLLFCSIGQARADAREELERSYISGVSVELSLNRAAQPLRPCRSNAITLHGFDPITGVSRKVEIEYYEPTVDRKLSASMVIVPPFYGVNFLDQVNARGFCKRGLSTAILKSWEYYASKGIGWENHDIDTVRAISAIRNTVEFLTQQNNGSVGILGTSQGAIFSSLALSVEPLLKAGILIAGGGPQSAVLAKSNLKAALKLKKLRMKEYGISNDRDYERILASQIKFNVLSLARLADPKRLLFFIATGDRTVPTSSQIALWSAWGSPAKVDIPLDHVPAIISANAFHHYKMMNFFLEQLRLR